MVSLKCEDFDIQKIADSGQCFRMNKIDEKHYLAIAGDKCVVIESLKDGAILHCDNTQYEDFWRNYFDMDTDYAKFRAAVNKGDKFLLRAAEYSKGIRILRQDAFEMLITFIISQRKNIPAIKKSVELICEACGTKIQSAGHSVYAFPTPEQLCLLSEQTLKECSLGYRVKYIQAAANNAKNMAPNVAMLCQKNDEELMQELLKIQGVGVKVANCTMLFGYYRLSGFPRDVWIQRLIDVVYGGEFDTAQYAGFEGVIQQYMFYYGRTKECADTYLNADIK